MTAPPAPRRSAITRFALRDSARLAYDPGESVDATAPVVVLLHDLLADRSQVLAVRAAVVDDPAPVRVIAPDARGHGASAALANRRLALAGLAADVLAVLDAEGVPQAHLVGHGLGGATAFALARAAPERVRSLTLLEPALLGALAADPAPAARAVGDEARVIARAAAEAADRGQTDQALGRWLDPRWGTGWRERLPRPRLNALRRHAAALAAVLTALDAYAVGPADAAPVVAPVLVVHGAAAPAAVRLTSERLAAWLPAGRLRTVPPATDPADPLAGEAGAGFAALLGAFLAEVDGRGPPEEAPS